MAVRVITAPPGKGKTLNMTRIAIELYREANPFFSRHKKSYIHYNSIFSNYPILLWYQKKPFKYATPNGVVQEAKPIKKFDDEELGISYFVECAEDEREFYGVFSLKCRFTDMRIKHNFGFNASFFIDELQYIYDSMEYSDFPDCIAHFFQVHRHLNYNMIYTNSQSLSRVIKRVLCVSEEFWNVIDLKTYKLLPFLTKVEFKITNEIMSSKNTENDLGDDPNAVYETKRFFNKRVFNGYITKYLGELNSELPFYKNEPYTGLKMAKNDILFGFKVTPQEKEELKKMPF